MRGNFDEVTKPRKRSELSYQNAILLIKFDAGGKFFFFKISLMIFSQTKYQKIQKIAKITITTTKIGYFPQFGIFGDISGFRQSQINLLIYLLFFVDKLQKQR